MALGPNKSYLTAFLSAHGIAPSPGANVYFVNNSSSNLPEGAIGGSNSNSGLSPYEPKSTLAGAQTAASAGRGDVIVVMPGHAETLTAALDISKSGLQIVGCKLGNKRPTFTINGAVDLFSISAANVLVQALEFNIVTTDAATAFVNVAAANCTLRDLYFIPSATSVNVVDVITLASGANDTVIEGCIGFNTVVPVNSWVSIEAAVARCHLKQNTFRGDVATAGIIDGATATQLILEGNKIVTIGTNIPGCILDNNPTGQAYGNHMYGTDATIANNAQWGSALILGDNYTRGGTGSTVSATNIIPALDT